MKEDIVYTTRKDKDTLRLNLQGHEVRCPRFRPTGRRRSFLLFASAILILSMLAGCGGPSIQELEPIDYTPLPGDDWEVSTPAEQGLDPMLVAEPYYNAAESGTLYGLLLEVKKGYLIAEGYFKGSVEQLSSRMSATKSFASALVGTALHQGCLSSVDQKRSTRHTPGSATHCRDTLLAWAMANTGQGACASIAPVRVEGGGCVALLEGVANAAS